MQPKASLVVPCYNKADYISAMLDSVINLNWENLELILVNDGSTDGTRETIAKYESKLRERGYDLKIIDKENGGCLAAVYSGLLEVTGEYFFLADCDDEVYPEFISTPVAFLEENTGYNVCSFDVAVYKEVNGKYCEVPFFTTKTVEDGIEYFILKDTLTSVWNFAARMSYLKSLNFVEDFCNERRTTYEPLFATAFLANNIKVKFLGEKLYKYNLYGIGATNFGIDISKVDKNYSDKLYLWEWAIEHYVKGQSERERLLKLVKGEYFFSRALYARNFLYDPSFSDVSGAKALIIEFSNWVQDTAGIISEYFDIFSYTFIDKAWGVAKIFLIDDLSPSEKLVFYGAMGRIGKPFMNEFVNGSSQEVLFWDVFIKGSKDLFGLKVESPDLKSLGSDDIVVIVTQNEDVVKYVTSNTKAKIVQHPETYRFLNLYRYGAHFNLENKMSQPECYKSKYIEKE